MIVRIATKDNKFRVQRKFLFFWMTLYYGINEGGGSYYIEEDTYTAAQDRLVDALKTIDHDRKYSMTYAILDWFGWKKAGIEIKL